MTAIGNEKIIFWKLYTFVVMEVWLTFCLTTFAMGLYLTHLSGSQLITSILMGACYLFVIIVCIKRLVERLPVAVLMLLVPIAPLAILVLIISLLHLLQHFQ